jgi:hypothetical protein
MEHHTIVALNANQSGNWAGYNVGSLADNDTLFYSIFGQWYVPRATARSRTGSEYSATWLGIGGGCVNASCSVSDQTLIQTGTEQDVSNGVAQYSAWWETIPESSTPIANFAVAPGDYMSASIVLTSVTSAAGHPAGAVWTITLIDNTRHEKFSTSVKYPSSELSAEWITETPLIVSSSGTGDATLPNLSGNEFTNLWLNNQRFALTPSEEMQLSPSSGVIVATPSAPSPSTHNAFNICSYATSCAAPR